MNVYKKFEKELGFALQSSPIIYIPHFDYEMIDSALLNTVKELKLNEKLESALLNTDDDSKLTNIAVKAIDEYDLYKGVVKFMTKRPDSGRAQHKKLAVWMDAIVEAEETDEEHVFLSKNWQEDVFKSPSVQVLLQNFAAKYQHGDYKEKGDVYSFVIVSPMPVTKLPPELEKIITVLEHPAPTMEEILEEVNKYSLSKSLQRRKELLDRFKDEMTYTLLGLQMYEVRHVLKSVSKRSNGEFNPNSLLWALKEKQQIVKKSGIIEVVETAVDMADVGGLERLKEDIKNKAVIFKHLSEVRKKKVNLPLPKGCLIIGMPGCGKSLIAKAIASSFGVSLLRLDVNRLMGQYVGMSEENLRKALLTAESANPCVLWIDEVEKAFAGAGVGSSSGEGDMLVQRLMGQFLTWMQERKTAVYIVATANDVMRPEFMRKGRFDEVYFVDFPNIEERKAILKAKLRPFGFLSSNTESIFDFSEFIDQNTSLENSKFDEIAEKMRVGENETTKYENGVFSNGFSGAEIESAVIQVMENAYREYQNAMDEGNPVETVKIEASHFDEVIKELKSSAMASQITNDKENIFSCQTNIERIRELQVTYHFKLATKQ